MSDGVRESVTDVPVLPSPRAEREARREALLDAAERAVHRDGPAVSMSAVAAEAGITKPVLYRHFGDKGGLAAALAERHTARLLEALNSAVGSGTSRRQRMQATMGAYLSAIEETPELYRYLLRPEGAVTPEQVHAFVRRLSELLSVGISQQLGEQEVSSRARAWGYGIVGMVQAAGDWWLDSRACTRDELAEELTDLVLGAYAETPESVISFRG